MKDFAAIDFETANSSKTSVCSVGVVIVEDGVISDSYYHLICPLPNFYTSITTAVHGLRYQDTMNEPSFPEVWAEIAPKIRHLPLVAHNKAFDENCLKAVFAAYGLEYPDYEFYCTLIAARKKFKRTEVANYQLQTIAAKCGYNMTNHHMALDDALACAKIAMEIL